ncbi:hypothetical protein HKX48_004608 [Thoreauomyces humboldtii]|nr:hypothetical protein HKX48_004608 [Thoreauomyces humboldtii]
MFNHKGEGGKTTAVYALAWSLAAMGKSVIMFDMDSQQNLTQLALGATVEDRHAGDFSHYYTAVELRPVDNL